MKRILILFLLTGGIFSAAGQIYVPGEELFYRVSYRAKLFQKCPVLPGHQNDLADQRTLRKGPDAPLHHGLPAQIKAELIKPHAGGGPCRHQNG